MYVVIFTTEVNLDLGRKKNLWQGYMDSTCVGVDGVHISTCARSIGIHTGGRHQGRFVRDHSERVTVIVGVIVDQRWPQIGLEGAEKAQRTENFGKALKLKVG